MTTPRALAVVVRPVRTVWRRLTSMRTALILLFLLAVAAVPGSLLPQRPLNPDKTASYISSHGTWGRFLDHIGLFDVFGAPWFAAIYLLLFISLIGCLIPRIRVHARATIRQPLPAPRHLGRLPESGRFDTGEPAEAYATRARAVLGRRWRVARRVEPTGAITLSAEKGYSRETGNLLFHIALLVALVLVAVGRLYNYTGDRIVVQGANNGFCNEVSQYDSWSPGRFAAEGKVSPAPFCVWSLNSFTATYDAQGEPSQYQAKITYSDTPTSPRKQTTIKVNHPLRLEGDRLYLLSHGFVPSVTVTMPDGTSRTTSAVLVPENASTFLSEGAFKLQAQSGGTQDIGIQAVFAPSPGYTTTGVLQSTSAAVNNPVLAVTVYQGSLNYNGLPQSVYSLDLTKMHVLTPTKTTANLPIIGDTASLTIGSTATLPGGVTVRFDGWVPYASMQVSHDPAEVYLLGAAAAMVLGLLASLGVRRRRIWLRITPSSEGPDGSPTVVSIGGLARSDSGNFTTEFSALLDRLRTAAPPVPDLVGAGRE